MVSTINLWTQYQSRNIPQIKQGPLIILFTEYNLKSNVHIEVIDEKVPETQIRGAALNKHKIFIFHNCALEFFV